MVGKWVLVAGLTVAPLALVTALGASTAQGAAPAVFKGSISCSLVGTASFKPPLRNNQILQRTTATVTATSNHCKGLKGTSLTQHGSTLRGGKGQFTFTIPANSNGSCYSLASGGVPRVKGATLDWVGSSPIAPTKVNLSPGTVSPSSGVIEYLHGTSTGSFAGSARGALQVTRIKEASGKSVRYSGSNVLNACSGPGISSVTLEQPTPEPKPFSKNDNVEIGKGF